MSNRYVFIEDLHASEIGMDSEMGLLYPKGAIVDSLLPGVEELLLHKKKILPEAVWQQQQAKAKQHPHENKRGRGAPGNKVK